MTPIAAKTQASKHLVKGYPSRFIFGHQCRKSPVEYVADGETGCWVWQRAKTTAGYGMLRRLDSREAVYAHRAYYEDRYGPIPDGHHLHHVCGNEACVNPDHLEPVTPAEHRALHVAAA